MSDALRQALADRDLFAQTLWIIRGALGFDNDGEDSPWPTIHGMGKIGFADMVTKEAIEFRREADESIDALVEVEALVDRWWKESESRGPEDKLFTAGVVAMLDKALGNERIPPWKVVDDA